MAKRAEKKRASDEFVMGSGDYLQDRGYADPDEARTKLLLANEIAVAIERLGLSQASAGTMAGLKQPDISRIANGNVRDFSVWRLLTTLKSLGHDITIVVARSEEGAGRISIRDKNARSKRSLS